MSDITDAPVTEAPKPAAPAPAAPKATQPEELPDWARKQISDANSEAAKFRVQLNEAKAARTALEDQMAALRSEHADASSTHASIQSDFDRIVTAIKAEVPHEQVFSFAKLLQGSTEDELQSHAAELKSMFGLSSGPARAVDRSQGQGSGPKAPTPGEAFAELIQAQLSNKR